MAYRERSPRKKLRHGSTFRHYAVFFSKQFRPSVRTPHLPIRQAAECSGHSLPVLLSPHVKPTDWLQDPFPPETLEFESYQSPVLIVIDDSLPDTYPDTQVH